MKMEIIAKTSTLAVKGNGISYLKRHWTLYVMMVIPMTFFIIFKYIPMAGVMVAFKDYNIFKGVWASQWVGFAVFKEIFAMPEFYKALRNTLMLNVLGLLTFPVPIILAILLNELRVHWYKKISQTLMYLPHFISWVIVGGMAIELLSTNNGSINHMLMAIGASPIPFLEKPVLWITTYVGTGVWRNAGWGTILYLAALTGINKELYEAAEVDGASRIRKIWHITLPGIKPTIIVLLILQIGNMANISFEQPYVLKNSYVMDYAQVISTYVYSVGIQSARFALATAVGLFQSVVGLILLLTAEFISRRINNQGIF
ncbi:putative multiple-sugar transport system permease YteP [Paenibacillus allorhizoplanae]|uniref:Multiple-sugar transport system permease YteP n=2 Tax=Paenibacillus allorhizoplanae TaxID=2905648 RepID=A0ABN8GAN0_9BACL|nr:ABC transporter permease subunit [Paenibacillus allorhizoplanae]CAH1202198.1 putative multiple-sugar transport system permease YteP [Paenibacillus allorhizoplanae]